jgi:lipid II:glycine glycyltransferase (peptidoglycan interpeptide bridge formation enzyme)
MRQTTRNSIRKAYRSKVNFAVRGKGTLESWHRLYTDTAKRKHFYYESLPYFRRLFTEKKERLTGKNGTVPLSAPPPDPEFHILTARKDNVLLSGIVLALCGRTAYYMYAGSSLAQRELMPNYGLQWEAMLFARRKGCTAYDLMGIPPNGSKAHPMAGLYIFKTGFGGDHVRYCGAWDYLYDEEAYRYFCQEEQLSSLQPHTVL